MKKNLFKLFTDKLLDYPLWVKQAVFQKLYSDMKNLKCENTIIKTPEKIFALYEPMLTFSGQNQLKNPANWLDTNMINFLKLCRENYNILEISLNTFLSIEETSKIFMFCIEQNYIEKPKDNEIYAMCGFISGKFRTGEYFKERNIINEAQLDEAVKLQNSLDKPIGEILSDLNFITKQDIKNLFELKSDSKRRFILNAEIFPNSDMNTSEKTKYEQQIASLTKETQILKNRMRELIKTMSSKYDE